ncbi:MAG: NADPH-dependent FMN reductase, partial [Cryomorphaceae bacterium]|nr:NAD(P)H-dependent oxidoreductase [Flavobacteriales bacterium]
MTTVIAATDRRDSNSLNVARQYVESIEAQGTDVQLLSLTDLPPDFFTEGRYGTPPPSFEQVLHKGIAEVSHFIFVVPEYNGSFPGVLKFFLDIVPPAIWAGKKAALAGVASGRAGNLRGLDHLTA